MKALLKMLLGLAMTIAILVALLTAARAASVGSITGALLSLPRFTLDTESEAERTARMHAVAEASARAVNRAVCAGPWAKDDKCVRVWPGKSRDLLAAMIALGYHETRYSQAVQEGRCDELPKGMQCDHGHARGLWQQWETACPEMWKTAPGSAEELEASAWCAATLLSRSYVVCSSDGEGDAWAGAFGRYGARGCSWPGGKSRAATMRRVALKL